MKLTVFNGSPRGKSSNSTRMLPWIVDIQEEDICYLNKKSLYSSYMEKAEESDTFLFVFPLYVDSMPGITKAFFEEMENHKSAFKGKAVYFVIHSGFPEMVQSRLLAKYNAYFSRKIMEMDYKGTVINAGSESMQMAPDQAFGKLQKHLKVLGDAIRSGREIPEDLNRKINKSDRLPWVQRILFTLAPGPLKNFYWHYRARQHDFKVNIKARPYG